jgi:hypothetical protein
MKFFLDTEFHEYTKVITDEFGCEHKVDTIELISLGLVREHGPEGSIVGIELISKEFDMKAAWDNEWLRKNVLIPIYKKILWNYSPNATFNDEDIEFERVQEVIEANGLTREEIKERILKFVDARPYDKVITHKDGKKSFGRTTPEFWAYYADYDWVVFCWIFGRMIDLPDDFPMYCGDLKQFLDGSIAFNKQIQIGTNKFKKAIEKFKAHPGYPENHGTHLAYEDAIWNLKLYNFVEAYKLGLVGPDHSEENKAAADQWINSLSSKHPPELQADDVVESPSDFIKAELKDELDKEGLKVFKRTIKYRQGWANYVVRKDDGTLYMTIVPSTQAAIDLKQEVRAAARSALNMYRKEKQEGNETGK